MCGPGPDKVDKTAAQQAQEKINEQMWRYYQENYKPVLNNYISQVVDPKTTAAETKKATGQINADVMKKASPASPNNALANQKKMMNLADVKSSAEETGKAGVQAHNVGEKQNIINIGRGQNTKALSGLDTLASMSVDTAIKNKQLEEQTEAANENAIGSTIGAVAGAAAGYGLYGRGLTQPKDDDVIGQIIMGAGE
jgi:hypothetical protein